MTQLLPSARALRVLDLVLVLWVAAWIGLGVAIGINVRNLTSISRTVQKDGRSVQTIGGSLRTLGAVPFVGGTIGRDGRQIQQAGAAAAASGASSVSSVDTLSVLLAIAVAFLPSVPVFGFYLPLRLERRRESAAVRRAITEHGEDPEFREFLARRAIEGVGYHRLRRLSRTPWREDGEMERTVLAEAELRRLGINPWLLRRHEQSRR